MLKVANNKPLEEYLEEYEDYLTDIGRLNDKNDKTISISKSRKNLASLNFQ